MIKLHCWVGGLNSNSQSFSADCKNDNFNFYLCPKIETVAVFSLGATTFELLNTPQPVTVAASP